MGRCKTPLASSTGFWDPLGLSSANLWEAGDEATIGFLRHAEIKHGRVAMFAFVGYCAQANGAHWPWKLSLSGLSFEDISNAGSPPEQWDALPTQSKLQILGAISLLEVFGEASYLTEAQGEKHYMMGGKPGFYPSIKAHPTARTAAPPKRSPRPSPRPRRPSPRPCHTLAFGLLTLLASATSTPLRQNRHALIIAWPFTPCPCRFLQNAGVPHPVPFDLYDPFGISKNASKEKKEKGLIVEINNGRLAMCASPLRRPDAIGFGGARGDQVPAGGPRWSAAADAPVRPQAGHHGLCVGGQGARLRALADRGHQAVCQRVVEGPSSHPGLTTPPHLPAWWPHGLGSLLLTPGRSLSSLEARRGLGSSPQAAPEAEESPLCTDRYAGEPMAPFAASDNLPFVSDMLGWKTEQIFAFGAFGQ